MLRAATLPVIQEATLLFRYFCRQFGAADGDKLRALLRDARTDDAEDGYSQFCHALQARQGVALSHETLARYDDTLRRDIRQMNRTRKVPFRPTYFQYLARGPLL